MLCAAVWERQGTPTYVCGVPRKALYAPRDCLTRWPGGSVRPEIPQPWADKAADHAAWAALMQARLKRDRTNVAALARDMGVARSTLDLLMLRKSWPAFDVFTSMARAMHYWDIWADLARSRK